MFKLVKSQSQAALQLVLLDSQEHLLGLLDYQPAGLNAVAPLKFTLSYFQ
ncbi:MAG: hypothetical protein OIF58_11415 [Cohaesibacter sp.]|nr:hypothetical protein [Cohaesibacter sp.]